MSSLQAAGREYPLEFTVQAFAGVSERCPDGDFSRFSELLKGTAMQRTLNIAALACVLSSAAEDKRAFEDPGYEPHPLTMGDVLHLPFAAYAAVQKAVLDTIFEAAAAKTVEAAPPKKETAGEKLRSIWRGFCSTADV